jgi:type IV pilus assembly protein PilN
VIRINLLSAREAADEAGRRRDERLVVIGAVALVGVLLAAELTSRIRLVPIRSQMARLTTEVAALEEKTKELNALEAQRGELEEKLKTIATLEARKVGPVQVLANLGDAAPDALWLLEFTESGGLGTVSGLALDNQTIATFMRNLGSSPYFSNVDLVEATQSEQDGVPLKRFIVNARLSYTGKPLPPAPAGLKFPDPSTQPGQPGQGVRRKARI